MEYNRRMWESDELAVGEPAADIASFLFRPPHRRLRPATEWLEVLTAGLLPERFREPFGLQQVGVEQQQLGILRGRHREPPCGGPHL